jgi:hypothetical protein
MVTKNEVGQKNGIGSIEKVPTITGFRIFLMLKSGYLLRGGEIHELNVERKSSRGF